MLPGDNPAQRLDPRVGQTTLKSYEPSIRRHYEQAVEQARKSRTTRPEFSANHFLVRTRVRADGKVFEAIAEAERRGGPSPDSRIE